VADKNTKDFQSYETSKRLGPTILLENNFLETLHRTSGLKIEF